MNPNENSSHSFTEGSDMFPSEDSGTLKFSNPVAKKLIAFVLLSPLPGRGGWGNGYVAVPKGHPVYEMDYDAIHDKYKISVNGGLTFSASDIIGQPEETKGMWIVGFDTLHSHDTPEMWPNSESVMAEANNLKSQLEAISNPVSTVKEETKHNTLNDIKDRIAKEEGFKNWTELTWEVNYTSYELLWGKVANELVKENQELKALLDQTMSLVINIAEKVHIKELDEVIAKYKSL